MRVRFDAYGLEVQRVQCVVLYGNNGRTMDSRPPNDSKFVALYEFLNFKMIELIFMYENCMGRVGGNDNGFYGFKAY